MRVSNLPTKRPMRIAGKAVSLVCIILSVCTALVFASTVFLRAVADAQAQTPSAGAGGNDSPSESNTAAAAAIPLAEIAIEAESALARVRDLQSETEADPATESAAARLPALTREIDVRQRETRKVVAQRPSLEILGNLQADWRRQRRMLSSWTRDLATRVQSIEESIAQIDALAKIWSETQAAAAASKAPPEVLQRIDTVRAAIRQTRVTAETQRARALTVQNRVAAQDGRFGDALMLIAKARQDVLNRLFVKDSNPVWSTRSSPEGAAQFVDDAQASIFRQWQALRLYLDRNIVRILFHVIVLGALVAGVYWLRRLQPVNDPAASAQLSVLSHAPVAVAFVLSFIFLRWIYPEAPRLWWAILGITAIVPSVAIARKLMTKDLRAVLYAVLVSYFIDQVRTVMAAVELLPRLLFLAEMMGIVGFSAWLVRSLTIVQTSRSDTAHNGVKTICYSGIVGFGLAFIADAFGYVTFANLLGNALLTSAYFAVILYALVEVIYELGSLALTVRPLSLLTVVRRQRELLRRRWHYGLTWLAVFLWFFVLVQRLLLRERLVMTVQSALTAELALGSLRVSLGDVLAFVLTVWASFLVSRLVRFVLSEDFFPRVHLARGLPYAISMTLHYIILLVGFFTAVAALGVDMTRVTILAGAFSVGVGFGLQNIFNNFVSGLILLFERPVSIGDLIQIDDNVGMVERIGIRASIIRTASGSEVIVPNGKLISERLINWRLTNRHHAVELPIAVAPDADPKRVIELLERIAENHPAVIADPPPRAAVVKLTPDSIALELHAWTDRRDETLRIRSDLAIAVSAAFAQGKIAIR